VLVIKEIFSSLQGESTFAGLPCAFVRLAGCNLDCPWCDTPGAKKPSSGKKMSIEDLLAQIERTGIRLVEVTGGEPLLQAETKKLLKALVSRGYGVLLETNGSISLAGVDKKVTKIVDVKCPSSGHAGAFLMKNLACLGKRDELKFVVADRADFDFAKDFIKKHLVRRKNEVIFSPIAGRLKPARLAKWLLDEKCFTARLQLQLHKIVWPDGMEGSKANSAVGKGKKRS
jgi:7-carboxy-7-deazaguanine synthase